MITGRDFIFISSIEWGFLWQAHQEIASRLAAAGNRVLYIENMGVRTPSLGDAGRVAGRLKNWAAARKSKGVREVAENIHVCSPLVCPPFGSSWRRALNRRIFLPRLKRTARDLGFRDPLIWTYLPTDTSVDLIRALSSPAGMVIYHCVADFTQLTNASELLLKSENALLSLSDLVLASCEQLEQHATRINKYVYLSPHGVSLDAFPYTGPASASATPPAELANLTQPIIGYVGGIHRHVDLELIKQIATHHPEWTWVLVGSVQVDTTELENLANIKLLGAKPHNELVNYINQFAVCTVPYANTESTATVVPTKINEYLATGKPVVATELPTIREFNKEHGLLMVAPANAQAFSAAIEAALLTTQDETLCRRRRELAERADWGLRLAQISEIIEQRMAGR